ncbi:zinc resistance-associated protein [Desulfomicrobium macestii]|uniref:Zinc resistance-associated protein n=1 Tax=Desulfomicrobium macestii TaxID=90731 RepID=A0ABR9H237_9BACT|nr:periplasmic heavy metal sensor [Desulfomicrobium macestii]MBE1424766.1 zinc resistance-associated protein [Desulfomicrobium macestii]
MKRTTSIAILAIFGIIVLSTLTFAGPMRGNGGMGGMGGAGDCTGRNMNPAIQQLPQEKQDQLKSILDEHRKDMAPMHNAMWEKHTLLKALSGNPNTKPETITALVGELSDLRVQMQTKREALQARVSKEIGIDLPMGFGMHDRRGKGGHGRGHGEFGQRGMGRGMNPGMNPGIGPDMVPAPNDAPATPGA